MPVSSLGDMTLHFQSLRNTGSMKTRLATLSQEMSSGIVSDITRSLKGDTRAFDALSNEISTIQAFQENNSETSNALDALQLTLQRADAQRENSSSSFLTITIDSSRNQTENAALSARAAFFDVVNGLNSSFGERSMLSGTAVDQLPFADPAAMLASIVADVGGATQKDDVIAAIDAWFDDAGGGFETVGYLGNQKSLQRSISSDMSIELDAKGDDPAFRDVLKGFAYGAVAQEISATLPDRELADLIQSSGVQLLESADGFSYLQGQVGEVQQAVADGETANAHQLSTYELARSDLVKADPFETAIMLQDVQTQLETHFAVTARLSNLSLMDFLR